MSDGIRLRHRLEYAVIVPAYWLIRHLPYCGVRLLAAVIALVVRAVPGCRRLVQANIRCAMPELPEREVKRIAARSFHHLFLNMGEFIWIGGEPERIRRCYRIAEPLRRKLADIVERGERIIFVNPHLGNWEASGVIAPFFSGVRLAAIAKPLRNPLLNRLFNQRTREKAPGLEIIFARGAIRESLRALRTGKSLGTLIDQNTRVRDGGVFVNFFGIPVASSTAPATLKRYCDAHGIPAVIIYGTCVRRADGTVEALSSELSRPFESYADDREVVQELMEISERFIREYPDQYLWFYRRFQDITPDCPEAVRRRYPDYAVIPGEKFFRRNKITDDTSS